MSKIIDIYNIIRGKKKVVDTNVNYTFTDEDRQLSAELRAIRAEKKKLMLEKEKLRAELELERLRIEVEEKKEELMPDDDDEEEESNSVENQLVMSLLAPMLAKMNQEQQQQQPQEIQKPEGIGFSDDDILQIVKNLTKDQLNLAKTMPTPLIQRFLHNKGLPLSVDEIERLKTILHNI